MISVKLEAGEIVTLDGSPEAVEQLGRKKRRVRTGMYILFKFMIMSPFY